MERPSSQLENARPSGIKPPSRLPALSGNGRIMQETTQSELNARSAIQNTFAAGAPSKHKINGLPESQPKRKTLVERAGEPPNGPRTHVSSKSTSGISSIGLGPRAVTGLPQYRTIPGPGKPSDRVRPPLGTRPLSTVERPPSSSDPEQDPDADTDPSGKRKGTIFLTSHKSSLTMHKTRPNREDYTSTPTSNANEPRSQHSGSVSNSSFISIHPDSSDTDDGLESSFTSFHDDFSLPVSPASSTAAMPQKHEVIPEGLEWGRKPFRNVSLTTAFAGLSISPRIRKPSSKHTPLLTRINEEKSPSKIPKFSCTPVIDRSASSQTPNRIPVRSTSAHMRPAHQPAPSVSNSDGARRKINILPVFLTKEKLTPVAAWDTKGRLDDMETMFWRLRSEMDSASHSKQTLEESLSVYKSRVQELTTESREWAAKNRTITADLERARNELHTTTADLRQVRRDHEREVLDLERKYTRELAEAQLKGEKDTQRLERERERDGDKFTRQLEDAKKAWEKQKDTETADLTTQHWEEMEETRAEHDKALSRLQQELHGLRQAGESRATESASEVQLLRESMSSLETQLSSNNSTINSLRSRITTYEARITSLEQEKLSLESKTHFLEGNQEAQSSEFTTMSQRLQDAIETKEATLLTLRAEEMLRRKLNATILELRGNIRVFVRTRPLLSGEEEPAKVEFPDEESLEGCREMVVHAPTTQSATGKTRNEKHAYAFDRVFAPGTQNSAVFDECSELIQSVVDGYNVSILSYGQTGSGKTYGMTGPEGIIPSSIRMLLTELQRLRDKGWAYVVEANFVEVYNETLNDLLGDAKTWDESADDAPNASTRSSKRKERHEIHHDAATGKTTVANLTTIPLWPPPDDGSTTHPPAATATDDDTSSATTSAALSYTESAVTSLLDTASKNRRVAATKANERSSRSHSIFMLTLRGSCAATAESCEGVLNLVDLAGSERLKQSGAEGSRMKETQAINKSLSSLGDVIAALGNRGAGAGGNSEAHIPYRNSKLTYLLQSSLGGTSTGPHAKSSRTLMLLHLSPLLAHWQESRSSLLFGTKVHGTHIGTAKKR